MEKFQNKTESTITAIVFAAVLGIASSIPAGSNNRMTNMTEASEGVYVSGKKVFKTNLHLGPPTDKTLATAHAEWIALLAEYGG